MFRQIVVAVDDSREASRALEAAVHLAKRLDAGLKAISVIEPLPSYTAFATAVDSSIPQSLTDDRRQAYEAVLARARGYASSEGIHLSTDLLEGAEVKSIVTYVTHNETDLLVIGLTHHESHISRLWSSVYSISQAIPCSVLGVH
jgi:nucleotide-binding universal stress UspA family protein